MANLEILKAVRLKIPFFLDILRRLTGRLNPSVSVNHTFRPLNMVALRLRSE